MSERHWKCKLGFHLWGQFYIRPMSSTIPWHGHAQDCTRGQGCTHTMFYAYPPGNVDEVGYRREDKS